MFNTISKIYRLWPELPIPTNKTMINRQFVFKSILNYDLYWKAEKIEAKIDYITLKNTIKQHRPLLDILQPRYLKY